MPMKWYIVHTYSGYEGKVKLALEQRIEELGLQDLFGEILVPQQEVQQKLKDGGTRKGTKKLFPGYVIVEMTMANESWHLINETAKVTGFVGGGKKPRPVPMSQIDALRETLSSGQVAEPIDIAVDKGDSVRITAGPFANFVGVVEQSRPDRQKVRVLVSIFGRSTPIDLDFNQIEIVK